jgi:hypothetical protein
MQSRSSTQPNSHVIPIPKSSPGQTIRVIVGNRVKEAWCFKPLTPNPAASAEVRRSGDIATAMPSHFARFGKPDFSIAMSLCFELTSLDAGA